MKIHQSLVAVVGALAVTASGISANARGRERADDAPVTLKVTYKVGDVTRSKIVIKASISGFDAVLHQGRKETVKEVKDNGDVVILVGDEGGAYSLNGGADTDVPAGPDVLTTRDKVGKLTQYKPDKAADRILPPEYMNLTEALYITLLPDKAVKLNDTWTTEVENPIFKAKKITVKDTYLGIEKVNGVDSWKIKQSAEVIVDADGGKTTYEGTVWLDPATGHQTKLDGSVKDVLTAQYGKVSFEINIAPVKDDKSKDDKSADKKTADK